MQTFIGMHDAGIKVTVVVATGNPNKDILAEAGVPTMEIDLPGNFDKAGTAALREELIRGEYDIMHTFNNKAVSNGLQAVKGLPVKIICYRGIVGAVSFLDPMSWLRYLNPRIDRIVCVCEAIRQYYLKMRPKFLRMPQERPVTIHKGHKLEWYDNEPADLTAFGIPAGAFVVGCTANYRPRKGVDYLIDAMEMLPNDIEAHLVLIGRMDDEKLTRRIEESEIGDRIHRVGFVDNAPEMSAACDVFCMPSTKREGLARSVIEAMAYRVPPVVSEAGGSPELVVDGECGYVVPVKDAAAIANKIELLYRDPALRRRMGEAARVRIGTDFQNEDTVRKTIALYEELVSEGS